MNKVLNFIVVIDTAVQWHFCLIFFSITVDFVIPQKGESLLEAYEKWRKWADEKGTSYSSLIYQGLQVGIPVQCLQCIWWKHHYTDAEWIWPPNTLDWLKPLKTFWYNSMNAFLTLLGKIEKVNSSLKVSDFLVL